MKKLINYFKKFANYSEMYSLSIADIVLKDNNLVCRVYDKTNVNPYNILASEILKNDRLLSKIKPREILRLKEIYDEFKKKYVYVAESRGDDKYKILYHSREFIMSGKDICKDMSLLTAIGVKDAFPIIYNTAYLDATKNYKTISRLKKSSRIVGSCNIIDFKNKNDKDG